MKDFGLSNFDNEFTDLPVDSIEASNENNEMKVFTNFTWQKDESPNFN